MSIQLAEEIAHEMTEARARTLALFDLVSNENHLHRSPGFGFRPVIWHLAHIGVFEAYWLLQKLRGEPAPDARYERIFDPIATPREESKDLPSRAEMEDYLERVRSRVLHQLEHADFDSRNALLRDGYLFRLVIEHERQHQETLAYLLQMFDPAKKRRPDGLASDGDLSEENLWPAPGHLLPDEMAEIPAGSFPLGATTDTFAYDNELPSHEVFVPAYKIDRLLTSNEKFLVFVNEGGYERREFWSEEGWAWREREGWKHPLYWRRDGSVWLERRMFGEAELLNFLPVTGVSWYEAEAYANFCGARLPTEAEWERAAAWDGARKRRFAWGDEESSASRCNHDFRFWGTTPTDGFPEGSSHTGCRDMNGNLWEWTATPFEGFPGFEPFPYPEYSQTWFDGDHRVLKGGSWATSPSVLRTSFRNFFRRHFRIAFAGIRLTSNA